MPFPGIQRGRLHLGQDTAGRPLSVAWSKAGHLLVAGKTGSGKSNFLRLLVHQALAEGCALILGDLDGATFPMLAEHPALLDPIARTPEAMLSTIQRTLGECQHRAACYQQVPGYPETLEEYNRQVAAQGKAPLPRLIVILDEFTAAVMANGGAKGPLASTVAELGLRGRKFGVNLVFAAQEFTKAVIGSVRDQVSAAVCFRVRNAAIARTVGCPDAVRIPESRPGLAITDRWGPLQAYYLGKALLIEQGQQHTTAVLPPEEHALVTRSIEEEEGRLSIPLLVKWGWTEKLARKLLENWELRGWAQKDPRRNNARYVTPKLREIWANGQAGQTGSNRSNNAPCSPPTLEDS